MASKIKALQQWCRKMAEGYAGVDITNFTTAWRDGLAFCAIIHRFRPDLIDFDSLSSENVFENCKMAFEIAEKELSIPAFLEAEDMVRLKVPDKLSIITYVSQYYNWLHALPQLGGPGVKSKVSGKTISGVKRPTDSDTTQAPITKKATTVETKENSAPAKAAATAGADKCGICHEHVYLIERHMEDGKLFHRSCFRRSELSPANKVLTRSPFMSPSLSSETPKLTASNADNKYSIFSKADRDDKVTNLQRHMDNQPMKTESDIKVSRKLDFAGSKHPIDEPGREDTKKSKMQHKTLFDDEKSKKMPAEKDKSAEYSSKKSSESHRFLPLSSKEAHKLEKRQEDSVTEKALKEKPDNTKVNKSVFLQQKSIATQEILTPSVASVPANSKSETKSDSVAVTSRVSALSVQPHSDSAQSKSKQTIGNAIQKLMEEDKLSVGREMKSLESVQSENKHTVYKDSQKLSDEANKFTVGKSIQKPSEKTNVDAIPSKSNLLPDIHNLQKMFSGKPSSDSSESAITVYPKAKPRTSLILEDQEPSKDAVATKPDVNETSTPKPVPRKNVLGPSDTLSASKQSEISSQVQKSTMEKESGDKSTASKPLAPGVSLSVSKNTPQLSTSATSSPFDKNYKVSLAERKLTETKVSVTVKNADGPKNVTLTNQSQSLDQKIDANKIISQNNIDVKSTDKGGHANVLNVSNVKKQTEAGSAAKTGTRSNQQLSIDKEQTPLSIASTRKDNTRLTTAGLSTTTQDSTVRTTLTPAKLQPSTTLSQVQNENKFISSRNPVSVTVNATPTSHTGPSVSQTETAHISAGVSNSTTFTTNGNGIRLTKNAEKSLATQVSKDSTISAKTAASTPRVQTSNKMQDALSVFSSGEPMRGEIGITFTNNSNRSDVNVTKLQKVNDSSFNPALSHNTDIHNKAKATSDVPSQNINQNRQAKPASSNLLNLKDSEQKSAVKNDKADPKHSDTHGVKSLSSVKNSAISGSKEDILDINNVRLKRVMPEQKEIQNGQKSNIYDVKLKKVDAIKGDTKWDSTPQKPSRSIDVSETSHGFKTADSHILSNGGDMKRGLSSNKGIDPKTSVLSGVASSSHTATSQKSISETPQWKKDAEERQRKLSANLVNSEPKTDNVKYLKQISDSGAPLKSDNKAGLSSNGKAAKIENVSMGGASLLKTSNETVATQKNGNKPLATAEDTGVVKKLDWQLEAEKRMAAIANFEKGVAGKLKEIDNGTVGKLKETDKSGKTSANIPGNQQAKKISALHTSDVSKDTGKNNDNVKLNGETITGKYSVPKDKTTTSVLDKTVAKSKETELKITVNKTKLTSVQEISTVPDKEVEQSSNKNGETEDFRQVLHQLKHVTSEDSGKIDLVKPDSETHLHPEQTKRDIQTPTANRAIPNNTMNKNNNNKQNMSEKSHVSDMDSIKVFNKISDLAVKTPDLDHLADENGNVRKDNMFKEVPEKKHNMGKVSSVAEKKDTSYTSPTGKRKISIQDTKVSETPTPSTPARKKKIKVTSQFDFDKSSDFERSLILSTAKLTIQGNDTPEKLTSSPSSQEAPSPQNISAIELQQQLRNIDTRLSELELKGRELEDSIRKVIGLDEDDDKLMIEWFTLINEKNELVRKEADLIYLSKEQELEDEQEQIESQLYYLMTKSDECKSPEEKQEEEYLINRKIALVEQRNKIVDSMDEDRIRYEAEDKNIEVTLKDKGYWKDSTGTLKALKGKKVANSMFYT